MCRRLGIQKIHSSAYHPQGDGQSERSIQSFKTALRCMLEERHITQTHWPSLLQEITFVSNSLPNASTGLSPHEIMFGSQLRLPLDKWLPLANNDEYRITSNSSPPRIIAPPKKYQINFFTATRSKQLYRL